MRSPRVVLAEIERFHPDPTDPDWSPLTTLLAELFAAPGLRVEAVDPLLRVLDRFQETTGFSPWWTIVTGIESIPGHEAALIASVQLAPTPSGVTLILRALARGVTAVDGVDLAEFAATAIADPS